MIATDKLLMRLSNLDALPGQESQVQEVLMTIIDSNGVKDSFGNLYFGDLTTKKKKIALYAHMDEVGFFVHRITEEGFVYFYPIGGWWGHVILGQQVRATCRKNGSIIEGVVGTLPKSTHAMSEVVPISEMYIDFGAKSKLELEAAGLQIGVIISRRLLVKHWTIVLPVRSWLRSKIRLKRNMSKSLVWGLFKKRLGHEDRKLPRSK